MFVKEITKYRFLFFISVLLILVISCGRNQHVIIKADLKNAINGDWVYLYEVWPDKNVMIDSAEIEKGQVKFEKDIQEQGIYRLDLGRGVIATLLILPKEKIFISTDIENISESYKVKGSPGSDILWSFEKERKRAEEIIDSARLLLFKNRYIENNDSLQSKVDSIFEDVYWNQRRYVETFVRKNPSSIASVVALFQPIGNTFVMDIKRDYQLFCFLDSSLYGLYPKSAHVAALHQYVQKAKAEKANIQLLAQSLQNGKVMPDFVLPDETGKLVSLRQYANYKVILYFWDASDPKFNILQGELNRWFVSNITNADNIKLICIGFDQDSERWEIRSQLYAKNFLQLHDSKGIYSELLKNYLIDKLPYFYYLNHGNVIVGKYASWEMLKQNL